MIHCPIIIVGGGPVGLSLALELAKQGKNITVIDQGLDKRSDGRVLALAISSQQFLAKLDAWPHDQVTAIDCVEISHHGLGISQIAAESVDLEHLGYTVRYSDVCQAALAQVSQNKHIRLINAEVTSVDDGTEYATICYRKADGVSEQIITADLLIMAEGGKLLNDYPKKIKHDYQQMALVAEIKTAKPNEGRAYERFAGSGPLVLLSFNDNFVMVWSLPTEQAQQLQNDESSLIELLNREFTNRLGGAKLLSKPVCFPLKLTQTKKRVFRRMILIGNSAQIVHPVSAQGLNLGLRDVQVLSGILAKNNKIEITDVAVFDKLRDKDAAAVINFTHFLATKLESKSKTVGYLRGVGIIALSNMPPVQNFVARSLIFGV